MRAADWRWAAVTACSIWSLVQLAHAFQPADHYSIAHTAFTQYRTTSNTPLQLSPISKLHIVDALLQEDAELPGQYHPEWHWDNEAIYNASSALITLKQQINSTLQPQSANAPLFETQCLQARQLVGWGMHSIHDFYSHTTYTALSNNVTAISHALGYYTYPDPPTNTVWCTDSSVKLNATAVAANSHTVTSGYLPWQFDDLCSAPQGKCFHGSAPLCPNGIAIESSSNGNYTIAYNLAVNATVDWLQQVEAMLNTTSNTEALQCLYNAQDYDQVAIVLDGTQNTATYVQRLISALNQQQTLNGATAPVSYMLQTFNTTSAGSSLLTRSYSQLIGQLNAYAFTGAATVTSQTQCGAAVLEGILEAVTNAEIDTLMTVITSCAPTDVQYLSPVIHTAIDKDIVISIVAIGDCVQQDPHLPFLVQQLGGYYYATDVQDSSFNTYMAQATTVLPVNYTVLAAYNFNTSDQHVALTWETSTILNAAMATYNATNSTMDDTTLIAQTNGQQTFAVGPTVTATIQNSTNPAEQTLTIDTTSPISVAVYAQSTVILETCELFQVDGRISHYGWLPATTLPVINSAASSIALRATLIGDTVSNVNIAIIDVASGNVTQQLSAQPLYNQSLVSAGIQQYVAPLMTVPTTPFRCQVTATHNNFTLSRVNIIPFQPQTINVTAVSAVASLPLDTTSRVAFLVRNTDTVADNFSLAGYTEPYFGNSSTRVNGTVNDTLVLAAGQSQIVTVDVLVPSSATSVNSTVITRLSVTGTSGVHTGNFQANYMSLLVATQACPFGAACGKGHFLCDYSTTSTASDASGKCNCTDLYTGSDCTIARYATPTSAPTASPTSAPASESSSKELSGGAIAGAVIGSLVGVTAIGAAAFFLYKYYHKRRSTGTYGRQFDDVGVPMSSTYSSDAL